MTTPDRRKAPVHVHGPGCHHDHDHDPGHAHGHAHGPASEPFVRAEPKIQRNDPCPCGSGKKFKKCHAPAG